MIFVRRLSNLVLVIPCFTLAALAQSDPSDNHRRPEVQPAQATCVAATPEDDSYPLCLPPSSIEEDTCAPASPILAKIPLNLPNGTPLRIALDQRTRVDHPGEIVHGRVVEAVYAFDQPVIPADSIVSGRIIGINPVSGVKRTLAYANGNFSPFHKYEVSFDTLTLRDGRQLPIKTTVSEGTAEVVHLVSNPDKAKQKSAAGRAADNAKQEAKGKIQEGKDQAHETWHQMTAPGRMHRVKQFLLGQSPYRRQYLEPGTRFVAELDAPLDFGETTRTGEELTAVGSAPVPDSTLKARLVAEVSSATATRDTPVSAVLTEPVYSTTHRLILPANSRLVGRVLQAKPAHKLHHNGELRVIFDRIETPEEANQALSQVQAQAEHLQASSQGMIGNLEGVEVARSANMKLDEEGGAHTTDNKTRYLSTGLAVLLAAAASHTDAEHGSVDASGDPGVRTAAGGSGFRLTGAILSLAVKSTPVSMAFGAYGASASIYTNFLSRGHDVVLPKDTPLEIGFGNPHPAAASKPESQ
jgi:type IV secretory pathway VirB10-like protein